jgi:hypothetical protein
MQYDTLSLGSAWAGSDSLLGSEELPAAIHGDDDHCAAYGGIFSITLRAQAPGRKGGASFSISLARNLETEADVGANYLMCTLRALSIRNRSHQSHRAVPRLSVLQRSTSTASAHVWIEAY